MNVMKIDPEIRRLRLSEIQPDPENPREISGEAFAGLQRSIQLFGYVDLLVVNKRNMQLVSGHQRMKALTAAGVEEVPVLVVDVDDVQQRAMALSLNNTEIMGSFTEGVIPILERLRKEMPEDYVNLAMLDLRRKLAHLEKDNAGAGKTLPDDIPAEAELGTKTGDMWILGDHRLLCGDSTKVETYARLFENVPGGGASLITCNRSAISRGLHRHE